MTFPAHIREAMSSCSPRPPGVFTYTHDCEGAKFHSPQPLQVHPVLLSDGSWANLCGTCRDNLSILRDLLAANSGTLPWSVRREFGNLIRALALRGMEQTVDA